MKRVVILGRGGAGKSALARHLGEVTGLPVVELDTLFWQDGLKSERADYWRWVRSYRRRYLPAVMRAIAAHAQHAEVHVLRKPAAVRRFTAEVKAGRAATRDRRSAHTRRPAPGSRGSP